MHAPWELSRYGEPSKLDMAPFGSTCKVMKGNLFDIYVQLSHQEDAPQWQHVECFAKETSASEVKTTIDNLLSTRTQ